MQRIHLLPLIMVIIVVSAKTSVGDEPRSTSQTFVVHVPPKITFESSEVPPPPPSTGSASNSTPSVDKTKTAFRLSGTSSAGITAWIEVQSNALVDAGFRPEISLQIVGDQKSQWTVTDRTDARERVLQASSSGTGAATLIISSDAGLEETVIVTTIISKE